MRDSQLLRSRWALRLRIKLTETIVVQEIFDCFETDCSSRTGRVPSDMQTSRQRFARQSQSLQVRIDFPPTYSTTITSRVPMRTWSFREIKVCNGKVRLTCFLSVS